MNSIINESNEWGEKIKEYDEIIKSKLDERNNIDSQLIKQEDKKLKLRYDDIGYELIDDIVKKIFFEIRDTLEREKKYGVILNVENYGNRKKRMRQKISDMKKQIKALKIPNKIFLYNKLTIKYSEWQYSFKLSGDFPEMRESYYAKMKSRLWCNWFLIWR
ncbi:MAG: hypothetical protein ACFFDN_11225 [Candidatus Hodarchaeota archaeon]